MIPPVTTLRPAVAADIPALARVHVDSWRHTYAGILDADYLDAMTYASRKTSWQQILGHPEMGKRRFAIAAARDHQVCGFAVGGPNRGDDGFAAELYAIYLLPEAQGLGLGRQLFAAVAGKLHEAGFSSLIVWVLAGNGAARFYEHLGGTRGGEKTLMIGLQTCSEIAYGWQDLGSLQTQADADG
jgi:GNAT superfamily N-acetyltransferase